MPLGTEVGVGPEDIVLDGDAVPPPQKGDGAPPQFAAHVYCGQTAGRIKMALGMEVGLGLGHVVLDGDPAPLPKREQSRPILGLFLLWPNGWMHLDATCYGGRPQPRLFCVRLFDGDPATPRKKGTPTPPNF